MRISIRVFFASVVVLLLGGTFSTVFAQVNGDYQSINDGPWKTEASWQVRVGGVWVAATPAHGYPGEFGTPTTVTVNDDIDLNGSPTNSPVNLTVSGGANLTTSANPTLNMAGALTLAAAGANMTFSGNGSLTAASISVGAFVSQFQFTSSGVLTSNGNVTLGAFASIFTVSGGSMSVTGNLNIGAISFLTLSNAGNNTIFGTTTIGGAGFLTDDNAAGVDTFVGLVTNGGFFTSTAVTSENNMFFQGGITNNLTWAAGGATFSINNQTIAGTGNTSFANIVRVQGPTVTNNGTVSMTRTATNTLRGTGAATWTQGTGTLNYSSADVGATVVFNASNAGNTVNYDGTAQTIRVPSNVASYHHLILSTSGAKAYTGNLDVNGNLTVQDAATTAPTGTITVNGNASIENTAVVTAVNTVAIDGSLTMLNTTTMTVASSLTVGGSVDMSTSADLTTTTAAGAITIGGDLDMTGNPNTITASGAVSVGGHLDMSSSSTLNASTFAVDVNGYVSLLGTSALNGTGNVNVGGNWTTNTSTNYLEGTRILTFDGTANQTITIGTAPEIFSNFTINKTTGGVLLATNDDLTINGAATFTRGIFTTSANETLTFGTAATSTSGNANSYVDGPVTKNGNTAFTFPIGDGQFWRRLGFTPGAGTVAATTAITAQYLFATTPNSNNRVAALTRVSTGEYWDLTRTGAGLADGSTVTLYWENGPNSGITDLPTLRVARWRGTNNFYWQNEVGAGAGAVAAGTITSQAIGQVNIPNGTLRYYTFGTTAALPTNPLPIELIDFTATLRNDAVDVKWATASELNNDFFTVERATNLEYFEEIGTVKGNGTTVERHDYKTIDPYPAYGRSYYRLKQTDYDGKSTYSDLRVVDYEGPKFSALKVYPNPSEGSKLTVYVTGLKEQASVPFHIYNVQGQLVYEGVLEVDTPGTLKQDLEFTNPLKQGLYIVRAGQTLQLTQKLIID